MKSNSWLHHGYLSIHAAALNNSALIAWIYMKFVMYFSKISQKIKVSLKSYKNNRYFSWLPMYICDSISLTHFLEWEMFQAKVVEKIKTFILCSVTFSWKSYHLWDNVEKYDRARQTTDDNMIQSVCFACWIIKATDTHSEYVMYSATVVTWACLSVTFICTSPVVLNVRVDLTCSDHCALKG